jgi:predicted GIY-YIG superfamily endonuclease
MTNYLEEYTDIILNPVVPLHRNDIITEDKNPFKACSIYIIKSKHTDMVYIGSTRRPLKTRFTHHKTAHKKWLNNTYPYVTAFEILKHDDAFIELLETVSCRNDVELKQKERQYYEKYKPNCINKNRPHTTDEEKAIQRKQFNDVYNPITNSKGREQYYCEKCDKHIQLRYKKKHEDTFKHTYALIIENVNITEDTIFIKPSKNITVNLNI